MVDQRSPSTQVDAVEWLPFHTLKRWPLECVSGAWAIRVARRAWVRELNVVFYRSRTLLFGFSPVIKLAAGDLLWFARSQVAQAIGGELPPDHELMLFAVGVEDG